MPTPSSTPFGALLKRARLAAGFTQEALAQRAGISARAVSDLERDGGRAPRLETVTLLADALALCPDRRADLLAAARAQPPPRRHNLPATLTSFIGREREMAELTALLGRARLVTVVGVGGGGKTRLALEVAAQLVAQYPDGVWLVELAPLGDPALVASALAAAVGVREEPARPLMELLLAAMRDSRLLMLLDNCEHLLDACANVVDALLRGCPGLTILATSREALGIGGEVAWRVPSLALPEAVDRPALASLQQNDAVRLLVERARAVNRQFQLTERNAPAVAQVCRRLDGIPLALELAAARPLPPDRPPTRLHALTLEQLAARMDQRFRLLTGGSRAALPRQQTLRAALDWSHDLLDEPERRLFRRLAVFGGGCSLEAAEAVGAGDGVETAEVLDLLSQLVRKSLVVAEEQEDGNERYFMLETLRQYGWERLVASGEAAAAHDRHAAYYVAFGEEAVPPGGASVLADWQERLLRPEHANLRAAFDWLVEREDVARLSQLARLVGYFWAHSGSFGEGRRQFEAIMARPGLAAPTHAWAATLLCAAFFAGRVGEYTVARRFGEERLAIARQLGDQRLIADTLALLGVHALELGDYAGARRLQEQSLAICRTLDDQTLTASVLIRLGQIAHAVGDQAAAEARYTEGLQLARATGSHSDIGRALHHLGALALDQGDDRRARENILASVRVHWQHAHHPWFHFALADAASLAAAEGRPERALRLGGASAAYAAAKGTVIYPSERGRFDHWMATARQSLPPAPAEAAWAEGMRLPLEAAFAEALANDKGGSP